MKNHGLILNEGDLASAFEDIGCQADTEFACMAEDNDLYDRPEQWCALCKIAGHVMAVRVAHEKLRERALMEDESRD